MTTPLRVLIVDDERLFAELMRVALSSAADIVVAGVVHDVAAAIAQAPALQPSLVLSDYHLPDGTGADVARALRRSLPDVSVLVLTGDPSPSVLADVARSGAVGHLTKARGLDEVVSAVRSAASGEILFAERAATAAPHRAHQRADARRAAHDARARGPSPARRRHEHRRIVGTARDLARDPPRARPGDPAEARRPLSTRGGRGGGADGPRHAGDTAAGSVTHSGERTCAPLSPARGMVVKA